MVDARDDAGALYEICVRGIVGPQWAAWFDGLEVVPLPGGDTLLTGRVVDQAALHGILAKIRDLNLPLVSLRQRPTRSDEP